MLLKLLIDKIATCLKVGPTHIVGTLLDLPTSKHDLPSFTFDCVVVQVGIEMLTITVQGSFLECMHMINFFYITLICLLNSQQKEA